jgi:ribosomal protein S24E
MKAKFGGGKTTAFALVYDSLDEKKKYDSKTGLRRVSTLFRYSNETFLLTHSLWVYP